MHMRSRTMLVHLLMLYFVLNLTTDLVRGAPPSFNNLPNTVAVPEDKSSSFVVYELAATDLDNDALIYTIEATTPTGPFSIINYQVILNGPLDFESFVVYHLTIRVSDGTDNEEKTLTVQVTDVNDNSPVITGTTSVNLEEEKPVGFEVPFSLTVTDADNPDTTFFTLSGLHSNYFQVDTTNGKVMVAKRLDRDTLEPNTILNQLVIQVEDGGGNTGTASLTVTITDINDNPPICTPSVYFASIPENSPQDTPVETLICTDADEGVNSLLSFTIFDGDDIPSKFSLTGSKISTTATAIDYESLGASSYQYHLVLHVKDGGASVQTATTTVVVSITPVNEFRPSWTTFTPPYPTSGYNFVENTPAGTSLFTLSATDDDDGADGEIVYELVSVVDSFGTAKPGAFTLDSSTGIVSTLIQLDADLATGGVDFFNLTLRAADNGSPKQFSDTTVTIRVTDLNDIAPEFAQNSYSVTITENHVVSSSVIQVVATDKDQTPTNLTYEIVSGDGLGLFNFDPATPGLINLNRQVDLDKPNNMPNIYMLEVIAKDGGGASELTGSTSVTVSITSVNQNSPTFGATLPSDTVQISEDIAIGSSVAKVVADDNDYGSDGVITFSITGGNLNSDFMVDRTTGLIKTIGVLDFEARPVYHLEITAADGGTPPLSSTTIVTVSITNVNDNAPTCSSYNIVAQVNEDEPVNHQVAILTCSDADVGDILAYSIKTGNIDSSFAISTAGGVIRLAKALDYESIDTYVLGVDVIDQGSPVRTSSVQVRVMVGPVNEHPPIFPAGGYSTIIPEDIGLNTIVITVTATDADKGSSHGTPRYSIVNGDNMGQFQIDSTSGIIINRKLLDREAISSYSLTIRATDSLQDEPGAKSADTTVTLTISDVNDNPPVFTPSVRTKYVPENTPVGSVISTLTTTDDDEGPNATPTYSLFSGPSTLFRVTGNELELNGQLDYETQKLHTLVVHAVDIGGLTGSATFSISVTPTNDNTPVFSEPNSATNVSETEVVGKLIYDATATDGDIDTGDSICYYIISGNEPDNTTYFINPTTGELFLWSSLDYDKPPRDYNLTLKAEDDGGLYDTMWLYINVLDENDEYPIFTKNTYIANINENVNNWTWVLTVEATDADSGTNGEVTYSIVSGDGQASFGINPTNGIIMTKAALDYEVKTVFNLVVQAADGGTPPLSSSCLVIININDLNDNAPVFSPVDFTVSIREDATVGTSVTTVQATDADSAANNNNVFTYHLIHISFDVQPGNGRISTILPLDRETQDRHVLVVEAINRGESTLTGTGTVTVVVTDVNDNDPIITGNYDVTISEDISVGKLVYIVTATDADIGENGRLTFSIVAGNTDNDFKLHPDDGILQVNKPLDRERTSSYSLSIKVVDNGVPSRSAFVTSTITIGDVNDNDPVFTGTPYIFSVAENESPGTMVDILRATDRDQGENSTLTFNFLYFWIGEASHFTLNGVTGEIKTAISLDRETSPTYKVWCKVQDGGRPPRFTYTNATINVEDRNDNYPLFDSTSYSATTVENSPVATNILVVTVTDKDIGVNGNFIISINTTAADGASADIYMVMDTPTQTLSVKSVIDRETTSSFSFLLRAIDMGVPSLTSTASVSITVIDVNDNAPIFDSVFYNSEVAYAGQCTKNIATVSATDLDAGNNGKVIYSMETDVYRHLFDIDSLTGAVSIKSTATTNFNYIFTSMARDDGLPVQTSAVPATIRVDTFTPNEVVISFNLKISRGDFVAKQDEFILQVANLMRVKHPNVQARIWCIEERSGSAISPPTRQSLFSVSPVSVHLYALKDNSTDSIANVNQGKTFLTYDETLSFFSSDPNGTPLPALSGSNWDYFSIESVKPYYEKTTPWQETSEGIAIITIISLLSIFLLGLCLWLCIRRYRKRNRPVEPVRTELIQKKNTISKTNEKVSDLDQEKVHPIKTLEGLPYPEEPMKDFFWGISTAPTSTTGGRLNRSTISPKQKPFPRPVPSFDGIAVDPVTGRMYEYSTRTNETKWLTSSNGNLVT